MVAKKTSAPDNSLANFGIIKQSLIKLMGYTSVQKTKDKLLMEMDISYSASILRQAVFLFLFGSGFLSLFFSGINIYFLYYGVTVIGLALIFAILLAINFPELYLATFLGYEVITCVDTSKLGRYKVSYSIIKKSKGLFKSEAHVSAINNKGEEYAYDVNSAGYIKERSGSSIAPDVVKGILGINNFLIASRPFSIFLGSLAVLVFSFTPILNVILILMFLFILAQHRAVQWKDDGLVGKLLILASILAIIVSIIIAAAVYLIIFIR